MKHLTFKLCIVFISLTGAFVSTGYCQLAFPGAEGFGATTPGGRGGRVILVTNTNDSGPGSFREALEAAGPRIVVFRTGGTITLHSKIKIVNPYLTIAGQTAPGGGVCVRGDGNGVNLISVKTHDIIVRHLRFRPGPGGTEVVDAWEMKKGARNIIMDHCTFSWGVDETVSSWTSDINEVVEDVTFQWCIISEALNCSTHEEGCHSKGMLLGYLDKFSIHHNLFANNGARSPMILSGRVDAVNNVVYNWLGSCVKIENRHGDVFLNYVKNYIIPGPDSDLTENGIQIKTPGIFMYLKDNIATHARPDNSYPEDAIVNYRAPGEPLATSRFDFPPVTTTSVEQAYDEVLQFSGATLPARDAADEHTVAGVMARNGRIIDHPDEVGGFPFLSAGTPPADSDRDGMPDSWETSKGLNPNDSSDTSRDADGDGYTNIEEYINELADSTSKDNDVSVTGVDITGCPSSPLPVGDQVSLGKVVSPSTATNKSVVWNTSASSVASVDSSGVVTVRRAGSAVITVSTSDGGYTDQCTIDVSSGGGTATNTIDVRVVASSDDAEEKANGGTDINSSDLELVENEGSQVVGVRFNEINIPQGAVIENAYLQFTVDETSSVATNLSIAAHDTDNAEGFASTSNNISARTKTSAEVSWAPAAWSTVGQSGAAQRSPQLKTIVQEIVNRSDWSKGNSLSIIITGTGERTADSYDGSPSTAPLLHVDFSTGSSVTAESSLKGLSKLRDVHFKPYPNPTHGVFSFRLVEKQYVEVLDVFGRTVFAKVMEAGDHTVDISHQGLKGLHFLSAGTRKVKLVFE